MCTVSLIYTDNLVRLACNRDESITRPNAISPRVDQIGSNQVIMPIDPQAGGTWIAASSSGLLFALLNYNPTPARNVSTGRVTRGALIPKLADCDDLDEVEQKIKCMDLKDYAAFRLLVSDRSKWFQASWDRRWLHVTRSSKPDQPIMLTSSGLGDDLVDLPRRRLFNSLILRSSNPVSSQDTFHNHHWPEAGWLSVKMKREDARTVSQTTIEMTNITAKINYISLPDGQATTSILEIETGMLV